MVVVTIDERHLHGRAGETRAPAVPTVDHDAARHASAITFAMAEPHAVEPDVHVTTLRTLTAGRMQLGGGATDASSIDGGTPTM